MNYYSLLILGINGDQIRGLYLGMATFRGHPQYVLYYINLGHLMITGVIPLIALLILNYLVYKHLRRRRRQVETLGKTFLIFRLAYNFSVV